MSDFTSTRTFRFNNTSDIDMSFDIGDFFEIIFNRENIVLGTLDYYKDMHKLESYNEVLLQVKFKCISLLCE